MKCIWGLHLEQRLADCGAMDPAVSGLPPEAVPHTQVGGLQWEAEPLFMHPACCPPSHCSSTRFTSTGAGAEPPVEPGQAVLTFPGWPFPCSGACSTLQVRPAGVLLCTSPGPRVLEVIPQVGSLFVTIKGLSFQSWLRRQPSIQCCMLCPGWEGGSPDGWEVGRNGPWQARGGDQ